ncbi:hypothetical protein LRAMOSA00342 [Lichtheimia ramosa]|uniref:Uncharacterized protein n=1 Tax=Lichtheimia ramosa TaxID=688394 RepID=A0A077W819_9FUNG|nr:hypothetical protein LRAMOSA00342 [Lichtheimia ramosa]
MKADYCYSTFHSTACIVIMFGMPRYQFYQHPGSISTTYTTNKNHPLVSAPRLHEDDMQTTMMRMRTSREITHSGDGSIMHDEEGPLNKAISSRRASMTRFGKANVRQQHQTHLACAFHR